MKMKFNFENFSGDSVNNIKMRYTGGEGAEVLVYKLFDSLQYVVDETDPDNPIITPPKDEFIEFTKELHEYVKRIGEKGTINLVYETKIDGVDVIEIDNVRSINKDLVIDIENIKNDPAIICDTDAACLAFGIFNIAELDTPDNYVYGIGSLAK